MRKNSAEKKERKSHIFSKKSLNIFAVTENIAIFVPKRECVPGSSRRDSPTGSLRAQRAQTEYFIYNV